MNYLYLKKHSDTKKLYLGWTQRDDYDHYHGSGVYWLKHLKKHGAEIETVLLGSYDDIEDLKAEGMRYSKMWDVKNNDLFANLKDEDGIGGEFGDECRKRMSESAIARVKRMGTPSGAWTSEQVSDMNKVSWKDPEIRTKRIEGMRIGKANSDYVRGPDSEETKRKKSIAMKGRAINKGKTYKMKEMTCPHCGLTGKGGNMTRYHFDNCSAVGG